MVKSCYMKKSKKLKYLIYILILLPFFSLGQSTLKNIVGTYCKSDGVFCYKLELKSDSSFEYQYSSHLGTSSFKGRWKILQDTLFLTDYEKPWVIQQVEEFKLDTLGKNSVIDVIINDKNAFHIRGNNNIFYIDGKPTKIKYNYETKSDVIVNFEIWVNNECEKSLFSDNFGRINIKKKSIRTISFDYDQYSVKNPNNNYFILKLSASPIYLSPATIFWTKWLFVNEIISPLECNKRLYYIQLKR